MKYHFGAEIFEELGGFLSEIDVEEIEVRAEEFAEQAEQFAEEISGQAERWAEEAEVWAEDWAEGMEVWAESFAEQSEVWSEVLEAQSERFAEQFEDLELDVQLNGERLRDLLGRESGGGIDPQALRGRRETARRSQATRREVKVDANGQRIETVHIGEPDGNGGWIWRTESQTTGVPQGGAARSMRPSEVEVDPVQFELDALRAELDALRAENAELRKLIEGR